MAGSFEVGSIIARIGIDDSPFVRQGRALLKKAKKLGEDLNKAVASSGVGAAVGGARGAAAGAAGAAGAAAGAAGAAAATVAASVGATTTLALPGPIELATTSAKNDLVRRAEELGIRIRDALRHGVRFTGGGGDGSVIGNVPILPGGGRDLVRRARRFGEQVREEMRDASFTVISSRQSVSAFARIRRAGQSLARFLRGTMRLAFVAGFKVPVRAVVASFRLIRRAARSTATGITRSFRGIGGLFTGLRKTLFNLRAAFAGIVFALGGLAIVNRAKEVESLRTAFENLTGAVGENAQSFIKELRVATRGAVSDMDLFRATNNAALLGVVKSQEEYVRLATVARRLGRAVGRTTVDALNDLSVGIGRQSRLILDNLGIVVRVDEANEKYANTLGTTVSQLTVVQKQQAFVNATLDAAEEKVGRLGPDLDNINDAFGRFQAALSNTATIVSEAFVGPSGFNSIATFLNENENNIRRFATVFAEVFTAIVSSFGRVLNQVFSGNTSRIISQRIGRVLGDIFRFLSSLLNTLTSALFSRFGGFALLLAVGLFASIGNAIIERVLQLGASIGEALGIIFLQIQTSFEAAIIRIAAKVPGLNKILGLDDPKVAEQVARNFEEQGEAAIERLKSKGVSAQEAIKQNAAENQKLIDEFTAQAGEGFAVESVNIVQKSFKDLKEETKDLAEQGSILGVEFSKGFEEVEAAVEKFNSTASKAPKTLRDLSVGSQLAQQALQAVRDQFNQILAPFNKRIQTLGLEVQTIGLEKAEAELTKFDLAFESVKNSIGPTDLTRLETTRRKLRDILEQRDAAEAAETTKELIKELDEEILSLADTVDQVRLGQLSSQFSELNREIDEALSGAPDNLKGQLLNQFEQIRVSLADLEIERVSEETRELNLQLSDLDATAGQLRVQELERNFNLFEAALRASGIEAAKVIELLARMRKSINDLQEREAFADLQRTTEELKKSVADSRFEFEQLSRTPLQQSLSEVNREFDRQIQVARGAADALIRLRREAGASDAEVVALTQNLDSQVQTLEELRVAQLKVAAATKLKQDSDAAATTIANSVETNLGGAIARALSKGESLGKQWAQILSGFVNDALEGAIKNLTAGLQKALSKLFQNNLSGTGAGALVSGFLGIGAAVLQSLDSSSSSTVDNFDESINSSEAVRGVVAGPTNVAISKIGESLKQAMRTTEVLLADILATLQSGGGAVGGSTLQSNAALPLSTSSTS